MSELHTTQLPAAETLAFCDSLVQCCPRADLGHIKHRYEPTATSVFTPQKKQEVSNMDVP